MKLCKKCGDEKPEVEFAFRNKSKETRQPYCKACRKKIDAKVWIDADFRERKLQRQQSYRDQNRDFILKYLQTHACIDCGEADPIVLDFDHRNDKSAGIAQMIGSVSQENIMLEMAKCDIRCANCHRRKTAMDFGYYRFTHREVG